MSATGPRLCAVCKRHPSACVCSRLCVRWGDGEDRCVLALDHRGPCQDASGETTISLAAAALARGRGAA